MVRPKAPVLFHCQEDASELEVMIAEAVWVVMYQNTAISICRKSWGSNGQVCKYLRTNFSNPAHAYRLADKLNNKFDTDQFTVKEINNL